MVIAISTITECVSISTLASLFGILIGTESSTIALQICAKTSGIQKYKRIIKNKMKNKDKIVLLPTSQLNRIEVLIFKALSNSNISHDEFVLMNNVLRKLYDMKEESKSSNK